MARLFVGPVGPWTRRLEVGPRGMRPAPETLQVHIVSMIDAINPTRVDINGSHTIMQYDTILFVLNLLVFTKTGPFNNLAYYFYGFVKCVLQVYFSHFLLGKTPPVYPLQFEY